MVPEPPFSDSSQCGYALEAASSTDWSAEHHRGGGGPVSRVPARPLSACEILPEAALTAASASRPHSVPVALARPRLQPLSLNCQLAGATRRWEASYRPPHAPPPPLRSTFSASRAKASAWLAHIRLKYGSVSSVAISLARREFSRNSAAVDTSILPPTIMSGSTRNLPPSEEAGLSS